MCMFCSRPANRHLDRSCLLLVVPFFSASTVICRTSTISVRLGEYQMTRVSPSEALPASAWVRHADRLVPASHRRAGSGSILAAWQWQ